MQSFFARILVWFLATAAVSAAALLLAMKMGDESPILDQFVAPLLDERLEGALDAYEEGGAEGMAKMLGSTRIQGGKVYVIDAAGRDLATGADRSDALSPVARLTDLLVLIEGRPSLVRASADQRHYIIFELPPGAIRRTLVRPRLGLVMIAVLAACWLFARRLSLPVRQLRRAVDRFGQGETSARIHSSRRDELGALSQSFDQMADRIEELVEGQRRLLLDVAHELRSPLARLSIAVDLLRSDPADETLLRQIETESERLAVLIAEILESHRPNSKSLRNSFVRIAPATIANEIAESCRLEASAENKTIKLNADPRITFDGNEELLRRAFENLVRNAIRYAPAESAIEIRLEAMDDQAVFVVRDRGAGVPENDLPRLFEPFYRTAAHRSRASGGVGLGLTIARSAAEAHGGSIAARNAHPGLEVEIRLPRTQETAEPKLLA